MSLHRLRCNYIDEHAVVLFGCCGEATTNHDRGANRECQALTDVELTAKIGAAANQRTQNSHQPAQPLAAPIPEPPNPIAAKNRGLPFERTLDVEHGANGIPCDTKSFGVIPSASG